jgi:hypothetical protein
MNGTRDTPQDVTTHNVGDKKTAVVERATVNLIRGRMDIDKRRIEAVRTLQSLGYFFLRGEWKVADVGCGSWPCKYSGSAETCRGADAEQ